jgi:hypothetical protein
MKQNRALRNNKGRPSFQRKKVLQTLQEDLPELRDHYGVSEIWLFGSYLWTSLLSFSVCLPFLSSFGVSATSADF